MGAGTRRLRVAYDVEQYNERGTKREYATQQRLSDVLSFAPVEAGLTPGQCALHEQGDGRPALLPTGGTVDEPRFIVRLLQALTNGLTELNEDLVERARGAWIYLPGEPAAPPAANPATAAGARGVAGPSEPGGDSQPLAERFLDSKDAW
jgi:hypothetical protein